MVRHLVPIVFFVFDICPPAYTYMKSWYYHGTGGLMVDFSANDRELVGSRLDCASLIPKVSVVDFQPMARETVREG